MVVKYQLICFLKTIRPPERKNTKVFQKRSINAFFSHMRLRKPTGSLVLDRSIRDGDLARGIRALSCKSKQSNAIPIVDIVSLRR